MGQLTGLGLLVDGAGLDATHFRCLFVVVGREEIKATTKKERTGRAAGAEDGVL